MTRRVGVGLETLTAREAALAGRSGVNDTLDSDGPLAEALHALACGDRAALAVVYDLTARDLYRLALWRSGSAAAAEDITQEVFVRLAEDPEKVARARRPRSYLLAMAHRCAVDRGRREFRERRWREEAAVYVEATVADTEERLEASRLSAQLDRLPAAQREALLLRYFLDLGFREIGRVTGVSTFTAASRCRLALARLRRQMGVDDD